MLFPQTKKHVKLLQHYLSPVDIHQVLVHNNKLIKLHVKLTLPVTPDPWQRGKAARKTAHSAAFKPSQS